MYWFCIYALGDLQRAVYNDTIHYTTSILLLFESSGIDYSLEMILVLVNQEISGLVKEGKTGVT